MWIAAASAAGIDFSKDMAEKQMLEKLAPRVASRLAVKIGEESAEKWIGRIVPLASSAIGGALNYTFVRSWGRRVQRHLREKHLAERASAARAMTITPVDRPLGMRSLGVGPLWRRVHSETILSSAPIRTLFDTDSCLSSWRSLAKRVAAQEPPEEMPEIRAQMAIAENLLDKTPDRGAVLYFLAIAGATRAAL